MKLNYLATQTITELEDPTILGHRPNPTQTQTPAQTPTTDPTASYPSNKPTPQLHEVFAIAREAYKKAALALHKLEQLEHHPQTHDNFSDRKSVV